MPVKIAVVSELEEHIMGQGFWEGCSTNVATTVAFGVVATCVYMVAIAMAQTRRGRLLQFFGINDRLRDASIFVSRLEVKPSGTTGIEDLHQGYIGPAIVRIEYDAALALKRRLDSNWLVHVPKSLSALFRSSKHAFSSLNPQVDVSPPPDYADEDVKRVLSRNLILLGGVIHNLLAARCLRSDRSFFDLRKNASGGWDVVLLTSGAEQTLAGRSKGQELAIIQRITYRETGNTVVVCAGLGGGATHGSVLYLLEHYDTLQRRYPQRDFGICLAWPQPKNPNGPLEGQPGIVCGKTR
jgi:hypothetical protein